MFANREEAGVELAERLRDLPLVDPIVLGIPRGGVVIAAAIAGQLGAELDVVLARKLRAPFYTEFAIGALGEDGEVVLNVEGMKAFDITADYLNEEKGRQKRELAQRKKRYRAARAPASLAGRSVILTDDGIATGSTMIAALQVVRKQQPREIIVAVPVSSPDRLREIEKLADRTICLLAPAGFAAVGNYYADFQAIEDEEVLRYLSEAHIAH